MKTISERIKEGLELRNLKQTDLVKLTGITKGALSSYISGAYEPKQRNIYRIAKALNVSEAWLMGLDVSLVKNETQDTVLNSKEQRLISSFNKLNDFGKNKAIERIEELTEITKYQNNELSATLMVAENTSPYLAPLAAHDDNLSDDEKVIMNERIIEALRNQDK